MRRKNLRLQVCDRDRGVCNICHCDTARLSRVLFSVYLVLVDWQWTFKFLRWYDHRAVGLSMGFIPGISLWQADHIKPLAEAGKDELENMQTLCVPCHKATTAALATRRKHTKRAIKRRMNKALMDPCAKKHDYMEWIDNSYGWDMYVRCCQTCGFMPALNTDSRNLQ